MTVSWRLFIALWCILLPATADRATAQVVHARGQNVAPVYEGWERNPDGTFTMVFGYFNRNLEEEPTVPVGPNNMFEPGDPDRGQPTHFYPRRQQFMFRVRVPRDWGTKELVWTLVSAGRTEKAYGTLLPVWEIGPQSYEQNRSSTLLRHIDDPVNLPPTIMLRGASQVSVTLPETLVLTVTVNDDGLPAQRTSQTPPRSGAAVRQPVSPMTQAVVRLDPTWRLGVIWVHHRGGGAVDFAPMRQSIPDGTSGDAVTRASFSKPGAYVLRAYADDGILTSAVDVRVEVRAGPQGQAPR